MLFLLLQYGKLTNLFAYLRPQAAASTTAADGASAARATGGGGAGGGAGVGAPGSTSTATAAAVPKRDPTKLKDIFAHLSSSGEP